MKKRTTRPTEAETEEGSCTRVRDMKETDTPVVSSGCYDLLFLKTLLVAYALPIYALFGHVYLVACIEFIW